MLHRLTKFSDTARYSKKAQESIVISKKSVVWRIHISFCAVRIKFFFCRVPLSRSLSFINDFMFAIVSGVFQGRFILLTL